MVSCCASFMLVVSLFAATESLLPSRIPVPKASLRTQVAYVGTNTAYAYSFSISILFPAVSFDGTDRNSVIGANSNFGTSIATPSLDETTDPTCEEVY